MKRGDRVTVTLPDGEYTGKITEVRPQYMWTGETWYRVAGDQPKPFITTCRNPRPAP